MKKRCTKCGFLKKLSAFYRCGSGRRRGDCKDCVEDRKREYEFGVSPEQYKQMEEAQGGRCAICRKRNKERLAVDHDHGTGAVRGLLCKPCNLAIGLLKDSISSLANARVYLEMARCQGKS